MNEPVAEDQATTRRNFLILTAAAAAACGCQSVGTPTTGGGAARSIDAGPASSFAADGVYGNFRDLGFFLIRSGGKLVALSSYCTHRRCKLTAENDRTFYCDCHGSTFSPTGKVTEGPAKLDLPVLNIATDANGHIIVTVVG